MTKEKKDTKCDDLIDALLEKHGISPEAVLGENGLIAQLKKRVVERALAGELTHHLGYAKGEAPEEVDNHRNGYSKKTVVGESGATEIEVPRDRSGSFDPLLIAKGQKRSRCQLRTSLIRSDQPFPLNAVTNSSPKL